MDNTGKRYCLVTHAYTHGKEVFTQKIAVAIDEKVLKDAKSQITRDGIEEHDIGVANTQLLCDWYKEPYAQSIWKVIINERDRGTVIELESLDKIIQF